MFQVHATARLRPSPFFNSVLAEGCTNASIYNRMILPASFGDKEKEYWDLLNGVVMWDVGAERQVQLEGPDAAKLAQILSPRDLSKCKIGQGKYVPICNYEGILINDPVLLQIADDEIWLSIADSDIALWAAGIAGARGMDVRVHEPDVSPLAIQGPKAADVVADMFGDWIRTLRYFGFAEAELEGIPLIVARSGWSKQGGYELYLRDGRYGARLWQLVKQAGAGYGIGPGTPNYIERVESGLISYGADTDDATTPYELGMDKFIDVDQQQDFVGKAALRALREAGVKRRFMGLLIDGDAFPATNEARWELHQNGDYVGYVSAAAYSPRVQSNIAVAMVSTAAIESCQPVDIASDWGQRTASIVSLPII